MTLIPILAFWCAVVELTLAYGGYTALLKLLTLVVRRRSAKGGDPRSITLLISAFNEQEIIALKIENALAADYPDDSLNVMVVSDGSTDDTDSIVARFEGQGVQLLRVEGRQGKTACLNEALKHINTELVCFSDANSLYDTGALRALSAPFADPEIGFVTGHSKYVLDESGGVSESVGVHTRLASVTKRLESHLGSCVGADGAIFAIRRALFQPLDPGDINDLVLPLKIVASGSRGVLSEAAWCSERTAGSSDGEFDRQARIASRTIRALSVHRTLWGPRQAGWFTLQVFGHKVSKLLAPFALIVALVTNVVLVNQSVFFQATLALQAVGYALAWNGRRAMIDDSTSLLSRISRMAYMLVTVNRAVLLGWRTFVRGRKVTVWDTGR